MAAESSEQPQHELQQQPSPRTMEADAAFPFLHELDPTARCKLVLENRGVPDNWRREVWQHAAGLEAIRRQRGNEFERLLQRTAPSESVEMIGLDVRRTFPDDPSFNDTGGDLVGPLSSLLCAYALYRPSFPYVQGMNYIAAVLLKYFPVLEDGFWMFVLLFEHFGVYMFYSAACFAPLCEAFLCCLPQRLRVHMESQDLPLACYLTSWFRTLFTQSFNRDVALMLLDLLWLGSPQFLAPVRAAAALHTHYRDRIIEHNSVVTLLPFMQSEIPRMCTCADVHAALTINDCFYLKQELPESVCVALGKASPEEIVEPVRKRWARAWKQRKKRTALDASGA